jgi:hypothetical protein
MSIVYPLFFKIYENLCKNHKTGSFTMQLRSMLLLGLAIKILYSCSKITKNKEAQVMDSIQDGHQLDGEPLPDRSIDAHGRYYAVAKSLFSGNIFCETGENSKEANDRALELCRDNSQDRAGCVLRLSAVNTYLLPRETSKMYGSWVCFSEETAAGDGPEHFRTWITCNGTAKTRSQAEKLATAQCRKQGAALSCRTVRCFNSDSDKRYR